MKFRLRNTALRWYSGAVCIAVMLVLFAGLVQAQGASAGDAAYFLRNGVGARALSMGGAFIAVADDVTAPMWNPAGLTLQSGLHLGGSYENQYGGLVTSQYLAGVYAEDGWGAGALWFNSDLYSVYFLSGAGKLWGLSFGVAGKLYSFSYNLQTAGGFGVDVGTMFHIPLNVVDITLGLVSRDIGWTVIRWHGLAQPEEDRAAWVTRLGAAVMLPTDFGSLMAATDFELALRRPPNPDETGYLSDAMEMILDLGVEVAIGDFALRAGLADVGFGAASDLQMHPTLGVGAQVMGIEVDVAWVANNLGATYLLSVEFGL